MNKTWMVTKKENWMLDFRYENKDIDNKNLIKEMLSKENIIFKEVEDGNGIHLVYDNKYNNEVFKKISEIIENIPSINEKDAYRYMKVDNENDINVNALDIDVYDNYKKINAGHQLASDKLAETGQYKHISVYYLIGLPYEKPGFKISECLSKNDGNFDESCVDVDITYKVSKEMKCQILEKLYNDIKEQPLIEGTKDYMKEALLKSISNYENSLVAEDEIQKRKFEAKRMNDILIKNLPNNLEEIQNLYDKSNIISSEWGNSYTAFEEFKKGYEELSQKYNITDKVYDDKYFYDKNQKEKRLAINGDNIGAELKDIIKRLNQYGNIDIDKITKNEQLQYVINSKENAGEKTINIPGREKMYDKYINEYLNNIKSVSGKLDNEGNILYNGSIKNGKQVNIVIGYPASGKSTISNQISNLSQARIVDSDEVKKLLPEYCNGLGVEKIHEESKQIMRRILNICIENGENIVLPIVGAKPKSIERYLEQFTNAGYDIRLTLVDLPKQKCMARNLMRYIETGRLIHPQVLNNYTNPKDTLELIKNTINEMSDGYKYNIKYIHEYNNDVPFGHKPELLKCYKVGKSIQDITQVAIMQYNQQNKQYAENKIKALKLK